MKEWPLMSLSIQARRMQQDVCTYIFESFGNPRRERGRDTQQRGQEGRMVGSERGRENGEGRGAGRAEGGICNENERSKQEQQQ